MTWQPNIAYSAWQTIATKPPEERRGRRNCFNWQGGPWLVGALGHDHLSDHDDVYDSELDEEIGKVDLVILLTLMLILMMEMMLILVTTMISKWFSPGTLTGRRLSRCRWFRRGGGFLGLPLAIGGGDDDDGSGDGDNVDYEEVILVVIIMIK